MTNKGYTAQQEQTARFAKAFESPFPHRHTGVSSASARSKKEELP